MSRQLHVALVGNPNCGKTTLFNAYSGTKHKVGNWPGVTVEKKEAIIKYKESEYKLVDLPGVYSLTPYSLEEQLTRQYILENNVDMIFNVVDASNLERNLYLTMQLIEIGKPIVIILNMMDVAKRQGNRIDVQALSKYLGVPVIPVIATKKEGLENVLEVGVSTYKKRLTYQPIELPYSKDLANRIIKIKDAFERKYKENKINSNWYAIKWLENDEEIINKWPIHIEEKHIESYEQSITDDKYKFITKIIKETNKLTEEKESISDKVDKILTNNLLGIPIFLLIMAAVFFLTFNIGNILVGYFEAAMGVLSEVVQNGLESLKVSEWLISLIVEGIIGGVGGILIFLPNIAFLFLAMALLEDSGYMSRVAYLMDNLMKKIGLSGKAFIPMILGFGCSVPAIMSARTLENEKDRLITMLITPFMSCSARLPIYVLFSKIFFPGNEMMITYSLYILGIVVAVLMALIFNKTLKKNEPNPLILELPVYKLPEIKSTGIYVLEKVKGYVVRAGTIIFMASIVIWLILNFNISGRVAMTDSIGAYIGKGIAPFFSPAGFGNWQASLSLIAGIAGKEIVVSSMAVIYGLGEIAMENDLSGFSSVLKASGFTALSAYAFMVFSLLYTPCVATIGAFKKETNSWKWTIFSVLYQWMVAWLVAVIVYQIGSLWL